MSPVALRHGSASYWKAKFESAQWLIKELSDQSIHLEEIPDFLVVDKVKPKTSKTTTRVTQVHGSMEGGKILEAVSLIQIQKDKKEKAKKEMLNKKLNEKEDFYKCREKCVYM